VQDHDQQRDQHQDGERSRRLPAGTVFIAAQFVPMAVLAAAYLVANARIEATQLGGVRLDRLLLSSAVVAPILSQSVSGPLFRSLEGAPGPRDLRVSAALTLRNLPRALLLALPVLALMTALSAHALRLAPSGAFALAAVLWVHLLFAAALVPAYAHRKGSMLVLGWATYAAVLAAFPTVWWAPALAGFASQALLLLHLCEVRLDHVPVLGLGSMLHGLLRGVAFSLPLWVLPVAVYLVGDGRLSPVPIFLALTPALVCYQVYFVVIATPVWVRLDRARQLLATEPYDRARAELQEIERSVRRGLLRVTGLLVLLLEATATLAFGTDYTGAVLFLGVMLGAAAAVVTIAEVTRLTMVRDGLAPFLVSAVVLAVVLVASGLGAGLGVLLVTHGAACLVCTVGARLASRLAWGSPEHSLFWARALRA
jgi:hypothetical protein